MHESTSGIPPSLLYMSCLSSVSIRYGGTWFRVWKIPIKIVNKNLMALLDYWIELKIHVSALWEPFFWHNAAKGWKLNPLIVVTAGVKAQYATYASKR